MKYLMMLWLIATYSTTLCQQSYEEAINALLSEIDPNDPGVSIGIVKNGKVIFSQQKGMANLNYNIPLSDSSVFRIASASKQFVAASIIHLHQTGKLKLTNTIGEYFPDWSDKLRNVTLQQLLNHTSGIRDYMSLLMLQESPKIDFMNSFIGEDEDIIQLLATQQDLEFDAGSAHNYSNTNYIILAQIVKSVSGKSIGTYAQENIFSPLGMRSTSFRENTRQLLKNKVHSYVSPCPECERFEYIYTSGSVGDGGLVTNLHDLALWENEYYNHQVLNKGSWKLMMKRGELNNGKLIDYAAGLYHGDHKGHPIISHSGMNPGVMSNIIKFPNDSISVIALGNQNWFDAHEYAFRAADIVLGIKAQNPTQIQIDQPTAVELSEAELNLFCGDYLYNETGEFRSIVLTPEGLLYIRKNGPPSRLIPLSSKTLTFDDRPNILLEFAFQDDGSKAIKWTSDQGNQTANSYEKPIPPSPDHLRTYVGSYKSAELDKTMNIQFEDGRLTTQFMENRVTLEHYQKDQFEIMGMLKVRFQRNIKNKIIGFRLDAPRAANIYFSRIE